MGLGTDQFKHLSFTNLLQIQVLLYLLHMKCAFFGVFFPSKPCCGRSPMKVQGDQVFPANMKSCVII